MKDIALEDLEATQQVLETRDVAEAIGDQLEDGKGRVGVRVGDHIDNVSVTTSVHSPLRYKCLILLSLSPSVSVTRPLVRRQLATTAWTLDPQRPAKPQCRFLKSPSSQQSRRSLV